MCLSASRRQVQVAAGLHLGDGGAGHLADRGQRGLGEAPINPRPTAAARPPDSSRSPDITATVLPQRAFTVGLPRRNMPLSTTSRIVQQRGCVNQLTAATAGATNL